MLQLVGLSASGLWCHLCHSLTQMHSVASCLCHLKAYINHIYPLSNCCSSLNKNRNIYIPFPFIHFLVLLMCCFEITSHIMTLCFWNQKVKPNTIHALAGLLRIPSMREALILFIYLYPTVQTKIESQIKYPLPVLINKLITFYHPKSYPIITYKTNIHIS